MGTRIQTVLETKGTLNWGPYLRYDLYKQIGAPEIKTSDDYLGVLQKMQEIYPENENKQKVYGFSLWKDWDNRRMAVSYTHLDVYKRQFLEDNEENVVSIVRKAHEAGAKFIYPAFGMTMRERQREWYYAKLKEIFPEEDYVSRYQKRYGIRYKCTSPRAAALWKVFTQECSKFGILYELSLIHI